MARRRRNPGFTLIELLVVIAIIAILAAILFPVFARARDRSMAAASLSNARQIGMAALMYARDWDDVLPLTDHAGAGRGWIDTLQPYGGGRLLNRAPGDRSRNWNAPMPGETKLRRSSYAVNAWLTTSGGYANIDRVRNSAQCVYVAECRENRTSDHIHPSTWATAADPRNEIETERYHGGAHYVFADGHARWHRFEQTWQPASDSTLLVDWYDPRRR